MKVALNMRDMYGYAYVPDVEVSDASCESIANAIEESYDRWSSKLSHRLAATVRVWGKDIEAVGVVLWWWNGTHTIRIDEVNIRKSA